ncbi:molybdopterin molybdotransferase MoeA [Lutibacter citreus]|uniref:molybdopterin molybdotransferase MoeA n=1 Tax=Lutibacter citreus TaxID=2138210 RepID=UPI000DBE4794|nr:molybdopterin molybdotransferase MoeA [Lutibacter citreus]
MNLTTVKEAVSIILNKTEDFGIEEVNFLESNGRVLKEVIKADRDFPPFNRVSMDGIAFNSDSFNKGQRSFKIEGVQGAGSPQLTLKDTANCIEAMTGAVLPLNTNAVIQYELLTIKNGVATINLEEVRDFQNIHKKGLDRKVNDVLIEQNKVISSAEIGVLATVGKLMVKVAKQPKVMIVSTGNELVEVNEIPEEHQIRRSNVYTLVSVLKKLNINAESTHILDDKKVLKAKIEGFLKEFDVLIFSGAVSKGKFDFIPEVLDELGVEKQFHKVKQRPGKPFWFGKKGHKTVFAFPGNPVSTYVSCLKYFYPWFYKSMGLNAENNQQAILNEDFIFKPSLTYFLQVKLIQKEGKLLATPISGKGSGDLANLVDADAFLELPDDRTNFTKGEIFPLITYR